MIKHCAKPGRQRKQTPHHWLLVAAGLLGAGASMWWGPMMADLLKAAMVVALCVLGLLAAILFSRRRAPADRLAKIIRAARKQ